VQGISWREYTITGQSNHAGTTPTRLRRDPGVVAASAITAARSYAVDVGEPQVATVGRVEVHPNLVNVVPASVTFTLDLRHTDETALQAAEAHMDQVITHAAEAENCSVESRELARFEPVEFDPRMIELVETIAAHHGHSVRRMPSGAGHDAQMLARVAPTSMIFVPSHEGISHNPAEHTDAGDLIAGADVLFRAMTTLAVGNPLKTIAPKLSEGDPA
jgi:N-carbamoyl-L-amino-acid hydrolase